MRTRRFLSILLSIVLILCMAVPAIAADDYTATSMTLEDSEGEYIIKNAKNKEVSLRKGAKLYKGYSVQTKKGYLWIGLDDTKAIKLDNNTEVTLKKSGNKLEVLLSSGKLFFNVTQPLAANEDLSIRTGNMSTSIRGTSGIVELSQLKSEHANAEASQSENALANSEAKQDELQDAFALITTITILDGSVEVVSANPNAPKGLDCSRISAGWQGQVLSAGMASSSDDTPAADVTLSPFGIGDALAQAPFAAIEAVNDPELLARWNGTAKEQVAAGTEGELTIDEALEGTKDALLDAEEKAQLERDAQKKLLEKARIEHMENGHRRIDQVFAATQTGVPAAPADPSAPADPKTYTVRFYLSDGNTLFATQIVTEGEAAERPLLNAGLNGGWRLSGGNGEYDFQTEVTSDFNLYWVNII